VRSYPLNQCLLYRVASKTKLATVLGVTIEELNFQERSPQFRQVRNKNKLFYPPTGKLRLIHDRILTLIKFVETRPYHQSDKKGCSNVKNAALHDLDSGMVKTDLKNYFPSVCEELVVNFFYKKLQTSRSVAKTLGILLCKDGFLVKGSPVSGFIAFWANVELFDKIAAVCTSENAQFTLYVDDLTISAKNDASKLLRRVDGLIKQFGYVPHKQRIYKPSQEKVVTGVVLSKTGYRGQKKTFMKMNKKESSNVRNGAEHYLKYVDSINK
jgi:RNA-directed DNA polymerase